jgi:protein-S-isoprenylcysteine O-methyltransferase Ste14
LRIRRPPVRVKVIVVLRAVLGIVGALAVLTGVVFIGQGVNVIHGSSMSGHGGYAGLGAALLVIGLALVIWAWRAGGTRKA